MTIRKYMRTKCYLLIWIEIWEIKSLVSMGKYIFLFPLKSWLIRIDKLNSEYILIRTKINDKFMLL